MVAKKVSWPATSPGSRGRDEAVLAFAGEVKLQLALLNEKKAGIDISLSIEHFTGVQRKRLLGEIEPIGLLFGESVHKGP